MRFSQSDLELFRDASGDRNPLHLSRDYAARTAYGQQVVFGALGAVACLGRLGPNEGGAVSRLTADFHRPMFLDVDYSVKESGSAESPVIRLFDGSVPVLTLSMTHGANSVMALPSESLPHFERSEARILSWDEVSVGSEMTGAYATDWAKVRELCERWGVSGSTQIVEALLWSSYAIGMELPGCNALFFRVALDFEGSGPSGGLLHYRLKVTGANKGISQLKISAELKAGEKPFASGQLVAFVRPEIAPFNFTEVAFPSSGALKGKIALVIGASRGLGAAITACLAAEGAHVIALSRSGLDGAESLPGEVRERISVESADAANTEALDSLAEKIRDRFGRLDYLVCSAFPAIPLLRLEPNAAERIRAYLSRSTDLVIAPLCTFLPLLNENKGCAVVVSSVAVEKPVRDWPHYVAAKSAVEGLAVVAPLQFPDTSCLIVRPDKLLTDMTNTPMGRQNAMPPLTFANQLVAALQDPPQPGTSRVFHGGDH